MAPASSEGPSTRSRCSQSTGHPGIIGIAQCGANHPAAIVDVLIEPLDVPSSVDRGYEPPCGHDERLCRSPSRRSRSLCLRSRRSPDVPGTRERRRSQTARRHRGSRRLPHPDRSKSPARPARNSENRRRLQCRFSPARQSHCKASKTAIGWIRPSLPF